MLPWIWWAGWCWGCFCAVVPCYHLSCDSDFGKVLQGCFSQHQWHLCESASGTLWEPLLGGLHGGGYGQWLVCIEHKLWHQFDDGRARATLQPDHGLGDLLGHLLSAWFWRSVFDRFWLSQRFEKLVLETKLLAERQMEPHALANCNSDVRVLSYACRKCCHLLHNSSNFQNPTLRTIFDKGLDAQYL